MGSLIVRILFVCFCLGFLVSTASAQIDPASIAGLWLFDEGQGDTAQDSSGNGFDGELNKSPLWVDGKFGSALEFKGVSYVELIDSAAGLPFGGAEPFSVTAWVANQGGGTIIGKFNGGVIGAYIVTVSGGGTVNFHREVAPWGLSGTKALSAGEFGHVAATYDGSEMMIYVDGELDVKQDRPAQNTDLATPVLIGARFTGGAPSDFMNGVLDEVALFNVALTEDQIQTVMKGLGRPEAVRASGKLAATWAELRQMER